MSSKNRAGLETNFYRGDYQSASESELTPSSFPYIVGALTYLGRLEEAQLLFDRYREKVGAEGQCAARCFLGMAYCRQARYPEAVRHFVLNLKAAREANEFRLAFYAYIGVGFHRYFCGRYRNARASAQKAWRASLEADFLYGKFLSADLIGHALMQTGQISAGLARLKEALNYSKALGGEVDDSVRISFACYSAEFGNSPASDVDQLRKLVDSVSPQDTYSRSALLLEIGHQLALRGKLTASQLALNQACRLIYSSGHRRQSVQLNLRYAYNLMLAGEDHQALNLIRTAAHGYDPRVDKALELQVLGLEYRLKVRMGMADEDDPLAKRIRTLTNYTGIGVGRRILAREVQPELASAVPGEDPLGDLVDIAQRGGLERLPEVLESGYLALLYHLLPLKPGESVLYFDLVPGSLLVAYRGNLVYQPRGVSPSMKALVQRLAKGECSKESLIESVWGYKYDPLRHDSLIYPAISRLRQLLGERAVWIEVTGQGYRLSPGVQVRFHAPEAPVFLPVIEVATDSDALNHRQLSALKRLRENGFLDVQHYKQWFNVSQITATRDLSALHEASLVKRVGKGRATRYVAA